MHTRHRLSLLLLMSVMSASIGAGACGDPKVHSPLAPISSLTGVDSAFSLAVESTQLLRRPALGTVCSSQPVFLLPFHLHLRSGSSSDLFLHQIQFRFIDSTGIAAHTMAMRQPELMSHFGSVGIPPLGLRDFPFSLPLACTTRPVSTLSIFVETMDRTRAHFSKTISFEIR